MFLQEALLRETKNWEEESTRAAAITVNHPYLPNTPTRTGTPGGFCDGRRCGTGYVDRAPGRTLRVMRKTPPLAMTPALELPEVTATDAGVEPDMLTEPPEESFVRRAKNPPSAMGSIS